MVVVEQPPARAQPRRTAGRAERQGRRREPAWGSRATGMEQNLERFCSNGPAPRSPDPPDGVSSSIHNVRISTTAPPPIATIRGSRASPPVRLPPAQGAQLLVIQRPRFLLQHDGYPVADGIGKARGAADKLLPRLVVDERGLGARADQDVEQARIHPVA